MALRRRIGLIIDEGRYQRLAAEARKRGTSITNVILRSIDTAVPPAGEHDSRPREAVLTDEPTLLPATAGDLRAATVDLHRLQGI